MPFNSIYPPLNTEMPNYNGITIDIDNEPLRDGETFTERAKRLEPFFEKRRKEEKKIKQTKECICCIFGWIILIILLVLAIYIFSIMLGTIIIASNYVFENTMVALFGRATYNKNFPVCINDIYQGNNCYTQTSTYCT